ncbi:ubiquinone biosynthesis accessory factor UbiJ [Reinekea marinisedimentorum]|uniref:Ubiquinone biosynthesis protein UbiJ n=1 Tax=Reinekea marinisedimentorum TaxID=230495 RepID=A0A4R3IBC1_9GAMM|nr:SCP2 sterol-binding domain-containing protein [Reinekea marinisedimentorum]TCS43761.1 ubiquinone biosynthesis protein UbiJ [Reinekea marinisedimentorum]
MNEVLLPVQMLVNRALKYDAPAQQKLASLGECVLVLAVNEPSLSVSLVIESDGFVMVEPGAVAPYSARVSGKAKDLFAVLRAEDRTEAMIEHPINIEGDTRTFFGIQDVLAHLDVDWEMALGDKIGDLPAHVVADGARFMFGVAKNQIDSLERTRKYMKDEGIAFGSPEFVKTLSGRLADKAKSDLEFVFGKVQSHKPSGGRQ